jgi:biotin transport system substrate-specific component
MASAAGARRIAAGIGLALAFAGLTALGANIVIPIEPVPITMQTLFVLLAGASIGTGWGILSQCIYVALGVAGLPIFAQGLSGPAVLGGPSGGYLISFLVTPWLVGAMLRRSSSIGWRSRVIHGGTLISFSLGVAHLTLFYTRPRTVSHARRRAVPAG